MIVSGGPQDNGGSLLRPGSGKMVSNFGGDGGDVSSAEQRVQHRPGVRRTDDGGDPDLRQARAGPERVPRCERRDDVQHLAAGRERAVHRAVHRERQEHQPVGRGRHEPLVPGQGLRNPEPGRLAEDLLAAIARAHVHRGRVLG